uniref:Uncharacterized protein n=1 Tax=Hyaloperonospora arabidopsidis (strain Emoy2) TaxID=559515 RepID=M4B936_HYAAE
MPLDNKNAPRPCILKFKWGSCAGGSAACVLRSQPPVVGAGGTCERILVSSAAVMDRTLDVESSRGKHGQTYPHIACEW